jgi:hypothetical protein
VSEVFGERASHFPAKIYTRVSSDTAHVLLAMSIERGITTADLVRELLLVGLDTVHADRKTSSMKHRSSAR